jgi:hypothetical protein
MEITPVAIGTHLAGVLAITVVVLAGGGYGHYYVRNFCPSSQFTTPEISQTFFA